jgi:S1-C subfamily serine protease
MRGRSLLLATVLVGGFIFLTSVAHWGLPSHWFGNSSSGASLWSGPDVAHSAGLSTDELNNIDIYKAAHDGTVNITSTVYQRGWFLEIYPSRESGSGFLINKDGQILTNNHVISGNAQEIRVTMADGSKFAAKVLVRDAVNDLGLVKIDLGSKAVKTLRLGDSEGLQVGQKVLAIGNPFGLNGTLTTGIVSSLGRDIEDESGHRLEGMIQTDAAINPGNSGGPLLDSQGSVIGINTAIYGPGGNIGIGFAMPINRAKEMLDDFQAGKKYARPYLGIEVVYVQGDLAEELKLPRSGGLLVQGIAQGSAAETAGLRGPQRWVIVGNFELGVGGDLIVEIDGKPVDSSDALRRALNRKRAGDNLPMTIIRNGNRQKINVVLGEAPRQL